MLGETIRPQTSFHEKATIVFDANRFVEEVPPGSCVCTALPRVGVCYGVTIENMGIYGDRTDPAVHVEKVNGIQHLKGVWPASLVSKIIPPLP